MPLHSTRALAVVALAIGVGALVPSPASAHPFGDPQTVDVSPDAQRPDVVHVKWRVGGPDDLTLLGVTLGLLPKDRLRSDGTVDYRYNDPGIVGASPKFGAYMLERITVTDGTRPCTGKVQPIRAVDLKGAIADYTCPGPVTMATVAVRTLTDLNPAYRTLATGPSGQRAVYDGGTVTHSWTLTGAPSTGGTALGRSAIVQLAAVLGGILLVVVAAFLAMRRIHRRRVIA